MSSWRARLETLATVAMISASVIMAWVALEGRVRKPAPRPSPRIPAAPVPLVGAPTKGDVSAKIVVMEFADYQCPFCGAFAREIWPRLEQEYVATGKVRFVFRNLPLSIHPRAQAAAEAALCAARQGQFWAMHDRLFQNQATLDDESLRSYGRSIGPAPEAFAECLERHSTLRPVQDDTTFGKSLGISGTPAFLIGTGVSEESMKAVQWVNGLLPYDALKKVLDQNLATLRGAMVPDLKLAGQTRRGERDQ